jgi:hypothetical protein
MYLNHINIPKEYFQALNLIYLIILYLFDQLNYYLDLK